MKNYLIILAILTLSGCRTVKKEWVKENYTSKIETVAFSNELLKELENRTESLKTTLNASFEEKIQQSTKKTTTEEKNHLFIEGTIEADSKEEKSVKVGNTEIVNRGGNVRFKIDNESSFKSEYMSQIKEIYGSIEEHLVELKETQHQLEKVNKTVYELQQEIETLKKTKTKEVKKTGFPWYILIIGVVLLIYFLRKKYKNYLFN